MQTPTDARAAMLAGMEQLVAAMKDRKAAATVNGYEESTGGSLPDEAPAHEGAQALERGAIIGRHVVLDKLGAGGMGVVYAAYDPQLDRKIALKLLLPGRGGEQARARLLREAQALGKLAHPNVVGIHDVGAIGEHVWLAMEFVQGQTLGEWLRTPRHWREVLGVMRDAGGGLAAAHAAGLLHRDFKPDNVMIGDDGRVRVMDFGLACARPERSLLEAESSQPHPAVGALAMQLTESGALIGTPSYMAPEQFEGAALTAAADQFAFCVTLWEGLYRERPFGGRVLPELVANVLAGRRRPPPKGREASAWLRRACERGLSIEPQQRWPSMDALLAELRRRAAPRRWLTFGVAGGLTAVGVGIGQYAENGFRCDGADAQLAEVWDEPRRQEVKEAILGTGLSYAPDTWERVEQRLDAYAMAWAEKYTEVCEATSVRQEQSPEVMDLRMECLRSRRVELREAVAVLAQGDPTRVEHAVQLVVGLPGLARCDDVEALLAELPPPEDPQVAEEVSRLRERLVRARSLDRAGMYGEGLAEAEAVMAKAETLDHPPVLAEALLERSRGRERLGQYASAAQDAEAAYLLAREHGHDTVATDAAHRAAIVVGLYQARHEHGLLWGREALALAKRGGLGMTSSDPAHAQVADVLDGLGHVLEDQGKPSEALTHHERALAIREAELGARHPDIAFSLHSIGKCLFSLGRQGEALTHFRRALAIREDVLGPRHRLVAYSLRTIGSVLQLQGQLSDASAHYQRALTIVEDALGPHHPEVAYSLMDLAELALLRNDSNAAREHTERAIVIREATAPSPVHLAHSRFVLARALWADPTARARARGLAESTLDVYTELGAFGESSLGEVRAWLAERP